MVYLGQEGYYSNLIHTWKILNPQLAGAKTKEKKSQPSLSTYKYSP